MKGIWKALLPMLAVACGPAAGQGPGRAQVVFADNCAPCHGPVGEGNHAILAPKIAGLPAWYVSAQIGKFRAGVRGAHADDLEGLRMRPMSKTLETYDIGPIADYVASLAVQPDAVAATGNGEAGKGFYGTCAACHGQDGSGNEAMKGPPIANLDAWYIESQLHKFRKGIRGVHPDDQTGATMRGMANTLPNDQAVADVAAYISTL